MKMKRFIACLIVGLQLVACDSMLDIKPEISTTYTNFFKTEKDAAAVFYQMHSLFGDVLCGYDNPHELVGLKVDEVDDKNTKMYRDMDMTTYLKARMSWSKFYQTIYYANVLLDNAYRFTDIEEERLEYYKRQVCFTKGVCYFYLARMWGGAPIVNSSTEVAIYPRSSVEEVLAEAIRNAEIALNLPVFEDLTDASGAKVTTKQYGSKGAATALLAHIYAWRAGLLGNPEDWKKAEQYCTDIIDNKVGHYELAADPLAVCTDVMERNSMEGIFEREYYKPDDLLFFQFKPYVATTYMLSYPTVLDASPSDWADISLRINKTTVKEMYGKGDRRAYAYFYELDSTVYHVANEETGVVTEIEVPVAFLNKWVHPIIDRTEFDEVDIYQTQDVNRIIWRLADIMLLRAECRARLGESNAADDLNAIRERAYGNREHDYTAAEGDLRYIIFKEREKELIYEGHRFYDVMRNGYWKTELSDGYAKMSEQEFKMGAQYYPVEENAFSDNDLMRQNEYWMSKGLSY